MKKMKYGILILRDIETGDYNMYDFYYDSKPIKDFNFNTIFYVNDYWLNLDTVINDAINGEIAKINAKYGVDITYEWDFYTN